MDRCPLSLRLRCKASQIRREQRCWHIWHAESWRKRSRPTRLPRGLNAPLWLTGFKAVFDTSKQVPGACQGVARTIHAAFTQLGGQPEYVRLTTVMDETGRRAGFMVFKMADGRDLRMSERGFHVVVRMKDRIYDAFTGAGGLPWQEYMSRLGAMTPIMDEVVSAP
jgi:hypothetical protein